MIKLDKYLKLNLKEGIPFSLFRKYIKKKTKKKRSRSPSRKKRRTRRTKRKPIRVQPRGVIIRKKGKL